MGQLPLKDLYIGKTDGYNEFLEYGQSVCKELFFEYPNFDLQKILNGSIYYICGDKGTGKTMLLKYVETVVSEKPESMFSELFVFEKMLMKINAIKLKDLDCHKLLLKKS